MTSSKIVEITPKVIDGMSRAWFIDKRVELISDGIVKHGVACILGSLMADPESSSRPLEFTQAYGTYRIKYVVLHQVSRHTEESLASRIAQSLQRVLGREVKNITYSDVDTEGFITFMYTAE
jgi:hypothetical protein